jgi:hypothetical protein
LDEISGENSNLKVFGRIKKKSSRLFLKAYGVKFSHMNENSGVCPPRFPEAVEQPAHCIFYYAHNPSRIKTVDDEMGRGGFSFDTQINAFNSWVLRSNSVCS